MTERERLAAEHALRLLEGEELLQARALEASDPEFAQEVREWEARLAPLLDEIGPVEPGDAVWERIEAAIANSDPNSNVIQWRRKVRRWQGIAGLSAAAAAALAVVALTPALRQPAPLPQPQPPAAAPAASVMVATLPTEGQAGAVSVTYMPERRDLLVSAAGLDEPAGRDHELWVIPAGGTPISLGVIRTDRPLKQQLTPQLARELRAGAGMAVSVEPSGGSPTGQPTGPVIASGSLSRV